MNIQSNSNGFDVVDDHGRMIVACYHDRAVIQAVDVDEDYWRNGIATKLYEACKRELIARAIPIVKGSLEGSGPVQLREKIFGAGNTTYLLGDEPISVSEAIHVMDVEYGYVKAVTQLVTNNNG